MSQAVITLLKNIWRQLGGDGGDKLQVQTDLEISSVTATDVTIHDGTAPEQKLKVNANGAAAVEVTGSYMEYYGATVDNRPAADSVPVGAMYMAVQTQEIWQTDGTDWVVVL